MLTVVVMLMLTSLCCLRSSFKYLLRVTAATGPCSVPGRSADPCLPLSSHGDAIDVCLSGKKASHNSSVGSQLGQWLATLFTGHSHTQCADRRTQWVCCRRRAAGVCERSGPALCCWVMSVCADNGVSVIPGMASFTRWVSQTGPNEHCWSVSSSSKPANAGIICRNLLKRQWLLWEGLCLPVHNIWPLPLFMCL